MMIFGRVPFRDFASRLRQLRSAARRVKARNDFISKKRWAGFLPVILIW
jgi:hypothetical protein